MLEMKRDRTTQKVTPRLMAKSDQKLYLIPCYEITVFLLQFGEILFLSRWPCLVMLNDNFNIRAFTQCEGENLIN